LFRCLYSTDYMYKAKFLNNRKLRHSAEGKFNDFLATNLGIVLGIGLLSWAIINGSKATKFFYNPGGLAIVLGGTIAATLISFPLTEVLGVFKSFRIVFFSTKQDADFASFTITDAIETSLHSFKQEFGFKEIIEDCASQVYDPFLRDGLSLVAASYPPEMVKETLEISITNKNLRDLGQVRLLKNMGNFSPTFGIIGTVIGLIQMMAVVKTDISNVGEGLATAFVATFYGALLANLFFHPMAEKLDSRRRKNNINLNLILTGTLLIQAKHHPLYIEATLNSFMPPNERFARFKNGEYIGNPRIKLTDKNTKKSSKKLKRKTGEDLEDIF
jgi:chemotaxis protein MotA